MSDFLDDEAFEAWLAEHEDEIALPLVDDDSVQDSDGEDEPKQLPKKRERSVRNPLPQAEVLALEVYEQDGLCLRTGQTIETIGGDFLTITVIVQQMDNGAVFLRGRFYRRTRNIKNQLPKKQNEVCWMCEATLGDSRDLAAQSMKEIPVHHFKQVRFIIRTNKPYPEMSFREDPEWLQKAAQLGQEDRKKAQEDVGDSAALVCRLKHITTWRCEKDRLLKAEPAELAYLSLAPEECDQDDCSVGSPETIRQQWRELTTKKGGSSPLLTKGEKEFHRQEDLNSRGQTCRQSLKTTTMQYPLMDIMERPFVGRYCIQEDVLDGEGCFRTTRAIAKDGRISPWTHQSSSGDIHRAKIGLPSSVSRKRASNEPEGKSTKYAKMTADPSDTGSSTNSSGFVRFPPPLNHQDTIRTKVQEDQNQSNRTRKSVFLPTHRYEFADAFCGAGGMSRGATMAGFKVVYGFDHDMDAGQSYMANNFETMLYNVEAHDFIHLPKHYDLRVDVLHLSPPCQFFSLAHTREGQNDEKNIAAQYALSELIKRCKPRIITLEQTAGLIHKREVRKYFNSMINQFTSSAYNVRWALLQCADFGVPQRRKRLFVIASCPGEPLPELPKPTHARKPDSNGLKPWNTINTTLATIPADWPNHDPDGAIKRDEQPYSGDKVINCICTAGKIVHPSGKRDFTNRELACLSTFPLCHKFRGGKIRKQIGNAVPPLMAKLVLQEVRKCLMRTDGLEWDGE